MGKSDDWKQVKYQETFEEELTGLVRRRQSDPSCKVEDLEGVLKNLYILDGANMDALGTPADIVLSARIAAYEHYITQWKAESAGACPEKN